MKITKNLILIIISIMATVIFSLEIGITIYNQRQSSVDMMKKYLINQAEKEAAIINSDITDVGYNGVILAKIISNDDALDFDSYNTLISDELLENELIFGMGYWFEPYYTDDAVEYYGPYTYKDDDGNPELTMIYSDEDYDYFSWDWYKNAMESEEVFYYTGPYYDEVMGTIFITESYKIIRDGEVVGITTVDITLREIVQYTDSIQIGESGEAYILYKNDSEDTYILNEDESNQIDDTGISIDDFSGNLGDISLVIDDIFDSDEVDSYISDDYITVWAPIGDTNMRIVFVLPVDEQESMTAIYTQASVSIILFVIAIIIFIVILNYILKRLIEKPLRKIVNYNMMLSASGDGLENDPLMKMHPNFDNMVILINRLLEERNKSIEKLNEKNAELEIKNEEIEALYGQTTEMNDTLNDLLVKIRDGYIVTVRSLSNAIEAKDKYTKGHCERVTGYAVETAKKYDFTEEELLNLEYAAILHDVGKIGISNDILNKPDKLTDKEYKIVMEHPAIGYEMLKDIEFLEKSVDIIRHHHEKVDGTGYPDGMHGDEMSLSIKILNIADAYDAMTSSRPYRKDPLSHEKAIEILLSNAGTQFDKEVVDVFVEMLSNRE